mmetsp:Transcript_7482/g.13023  ORF Transcript_7482/g.13023 Transcript_7482/m.13023 type:complete len:519 (+) Transcript_7482:250-1806(+)
MIGIGTPRRLQAPLLGQRAPGNGEVDPGPSRIRRVGSYEQELVSVGEDGMAGVAVSTYNLTSTILGAGILSISYALNECGVLAGVAFLGITATASTMSCNLLLSAYLRTGRGSYGDLTLYLFGHAASSWVKWIIILLNIGAASGYILVVKDLLPESLCQLFGGSFCGNDTLITGLLVAFIVFPLCTLKNISSLRHTSFLAFGFAIFLTVAISVRSLQYGEYCEVKLVPTSVLGAFKALPVFCFSFVCHLNVLPVYDQLHSRTPLMMRAVFRNAISFAYLLYCFSGTLGYLRFNCGVVPGNILAFGYFGAKDPLIACARIAEALMCTLALPLIQHPTRVALHSWLFNKEIETDNHIDSDSECDSDAETTARAQQNSSRYDQLATDDGMEDFQPDLNQLSLDLPARPVRKPALGRSGLIRVCEAFVIMSMSFALAMLVPDVSTIFGLLGATCCSLVCFILPGVFYRAATKDVLDLIPEDISPSSPNYSDYCRIVFQRRISLVMIVLGSLLAIFGTIAICI